MLIDGQLPAALRDHALQWWLVPVADADDVADDLMADLAADDVARLHRLHRRADRARFATVRSHLRRLLSARIGCAPRAVPLTTSDTGKPCLAGSAPGWTFNVSHSGLWGAIALAPSTACRAVGIDVEQCLPVAPMAIAEAAFSAEEVASLSRIGSGAARTDAFYARWTAREAYAKALGIGIADPAFQATTLTPGAQGQWHAGDDPATHICNLTFPFGPGGPEPYRLALAVMPFAPA